MLLSVWKGLELRKRGIQASQGNRLGHPGGPGVCSVPACLASPVTSDSATAGAVTRQALLSMGFCRQEHQSGSEFPSAGDLPDPGIKSTSASPALAGGFFTSCSASH